MKINELDGGVLYIEDAFPMAGDFIKAIEENDSNEMVNSIIPKWSEWMDGYVEDGKWVGKYHTGYMKEVDWDYSINNKNHRWPRIDVGLYYSESHKEAYKILKMIDEPYKDVLDIWAEKTGNNKIDLITKNYTIKRYNTGGHIGEHIDRGNPTDTFDWTVLIYLNDNYQGGDLVFTKLGHRISPKAGSVIFFPSLEPHIAETVTDGHKYFIFLYIQSKHKLTHALYETINDYIKNLDRQNLKN